MAKVSLAFLLISFTAILQSSVFAHTLKHHSVHSSNNDDDDVYKYPCPVIWKKYNFDDEPQEFGIKSGIYQSDDQAFIGRGYINSILYYGRIKIDGKRGFYTQMGGKNLFTDNPNEIWFLAKNFDCKYSLADRKDESQRDFVVSIGESGYGARVVIPRYSTMPPNKGGLFYGDDTYGSLKIRNISMQYLTCRSKTPLQKSIETFIEPSYPSTIKRQSESGCTHIWKFFKNNEDPLKDGVLAGFYDKHNPAYIGMTRIAQLWRPSRIEINSGAYAQDDLHEEFFSSRNYYLVDNPQNKYYWADAVGNQVLDNSVAVTQESGPFRFPIGRTEINGKTFIGLTDGMGGLIYPDEKGIQHVIGNYQLLVCDPRPKYRCATKWKHFRHNDAPLVNGFSVGNYFGDIKSFIGRTKTKHDTEYSIGRIQISPKSNSGLYYFNKESGREKFDKSSAVEYLVVNTDDTYTWVPSSGGHCVRHAIKNQENGKFMVGKVQVDDKIYVGSVKAGEGLIFTDYRGKKHVSRHYDVLTCSSTKVNKNHAYDDDCESFMCF